MDPLLANIKYYALGQLWPLWAIHDFLCPNLDPSSIHPIGPLYAIKAPHCPYVSFFDHWIGLALIEPKQP